MDEAVLKAHGIMFHHFYNENHCRGQGAISTIQFEKIIEEYGDRLLNAEDWTHKVATNTLAKHDVCLTFDDALLCQYDIALPVLNKYKISAFWFVYASVIAGGVEMHEVYRKFRTECFSNIDEFYKCFFSEVEKSPFRALFLDSLDKYSHDKFRHFPFYTENDTKFRFARDDVLGVDNYRHVMGIMIKNHGVNLLDFTSDLWLKPEHLQILHSQNHIIGLHSHSHPTTLARLPLLEQENEYKVNQEILSGLLGQKPTTVAHPCNSYSDGTLKILAGLGVKMGFRSNMEDHHYSAFEFPREDHSNVLRRIEP